MALAAWMVSLKPLADKTRSFSPSASSGHAYHRKDPEDAAAGGTVVVLEPVSIPSGHFFCRAERWQLADIDPQSRFFLNLLALHGARDVVRLPDRQRHDRQRRIAGGAGGELAAVRDEQVLDVVGLAELVRHTIPRLLAHSVGTQIVGA